MTAEDRLDAAFRQALGLAVDVPLEGLAYGRTEGWDSVGHMQLIAAIEESFGIAVDADDVFAMSSLDEVRRVLRERHGVELADR